MVMPEVGQVAPNFIGITDDNSEFELSNSKGNIVEIARKWLQSIEQP